MDIQALLAQVEALKAENSALRQAAASKLTIKVSKNGAVSVYGLQRWPVTLYATQWRRLLDSAEAIKAFIVAHKAELASKESDTPEAVPTLAQHQAAREADGFAN